jgi:predicted metalloendopeptidase
MGCNKIKESHNYYNKVYATESLQKYHFDWDEFSKIIGYQTPPSFYICTNLNYLKCVMKLLKENWQTKKWEAYFVYIYVKQIIRFHYKWRYIYFNFVEKYITYQEAPIPNSIYPIFGLSYCFDTILTDEYVNKYQNIKYIEYVENLAKELLIIFKRIVGRNTWLSPSTKKYALLKLDKLKFNIGSPKILREDPLLDYDKNDAWGNMVKMSHWKTKAQLEFTNKNGMEIPLIDWSEFKLIGNQSYIVNAFYNPTKNSIYIPVAYLQPPFIDLYERGIEYNLSHIGYTISHEMSHSLDDVGSKFDYNGNLHNWWTNHDRKIFNKKVNNVIKQYELFASYDGIKMDASIGIGEDLADISGLAICTEYLRDFQVNNGDVFSIRALSFQAFFEYIAIANRQVIRKKAIIAQLTMNPHPLNKYRTNCPLARLELFDSIYNVKKGDKMYWFSKDTIW